MTSHALNNEKDKADQVAEIISYQPGWIIRNGNLIFLGFFLLLIGISFFIYYPEVTTIPGRVIPGNTAEEEVPGKTKGGDFLKENIVIDKSLQRKIKQGDKITINFNNGHTGNLQWRGTVANISEHPGTKDSTVLYVNLKKKAGAKEQLLSTNSVITVTIKTRGQRLSSYLWKKLKSLFNVKT